MAMILQVTRHVYIEFISANEVRVHGACAPRSLIVGNSMDLSYDTLANASEAVEAAIEGALALEGEGSTNASRTI